MKIQQALRVGLTSTLCSLLIMPLPLYAQIDESPIETEQVVQTTQVVESNYTETPVTESSELPIEETGPVAPAVDSQLSPPTAIGKPTQLAESDQVLSKLYEQPATSLNELVEPEPTPKPLPSPVVATDPILVSSFKFSQGQGFDYIELYNTSASVVEVGTLSLRLLYSDATTDYECSLELDGYMLGEKYLSFAANPSGEILQLPDCQESSKLLFDRELQILRGDTVVESVRILDSDMSSSVESKAWERRGWTNAYREGVLAGDFKTSTRPDVVYTSQLYAPPEDPELEIVELLVQPQLCSPAEPSVSCSSYVKFRNHLPVDIDLSLYRLRSAQLGEVSSQYNTSSLVGVVPAGGFLVISSDGNSLPLAFDKSESAVWLEDKYGVISYPNQMTPYQKADSSSHRGLAWALDGSDNTWKWGLPNPGSSETLFMIAGKGGVDTIQPDLTACRDDQYRNPATNRCRLIASTESDLVACKEGQYRSPETNRCRSTVLATSASLAPCAANQFRNPDTNRCKSLDAATSSLKACAVNQERNPETNRCRKVLSAQTQAAAFAPEKVEGAATEFTAWWALGGVVVAGLAWVGWEYRFEIRRSASQLLSRAKS